MRPTKILLRLKSKRPQVKAFVNVRACSKPHPVQLHLGYLPLFQDLSHCQDRLLSALVEKWPRKRKPEAIDWEDAAAKLAKLRLVFVAPPPEPEPKQEAPSGLAFDASPPAPELDAPPPEPELEPEALPSHSIYHVPGTTLALWPGFHDDRLFLERLAQKMTNGAADAEDLVQMTILDAIRTRSEFQGRSSLRTWLVGIMRHRYLDILRSRHRRLNLQVNIDNVELVAEQDDDEQWRGLSLEKLLDTVILPPEESQILLLKYVHEYSYEQIAQLTGMKINTVFSRLARAKDKLYQEVRQRDIPLSILQRWRSR